MSDCTAAPPAMALSELVQESGKRLSPDADAGGTETALNAIAEPILQPVFGQAMWVTRLELTVLTMSFLTALSVWKLQ